MLAIIDAFLQIALRRRGPEDLPDSRFLLAIAALAYVVVQILIPFRVEVSATSLARSIVIDLLLLCGVVWGLLRFRGYPARFHQTLTAILGTGALLGACIMPFLYWLDALGSRESGAIVPTIGVMAVVIWSVAVNGHILARALAIPFGAGIAVSLAYFIVNYLVMSQFGPSPA